MVSLNDSVKVAKTGMFLLNSIESFSLKSPYVCKQMVNKTTSFSLEFNLSLTKCTKQHSN